MIHHNDILWNDAIQKDDVKSRIISAIVSDAVRTTSVTLLVRNRNIWPKGNRETIRLFQMYDNTYCAAAKEVSKKKHRGARSVQPAPYLRW